LILAGYKGALCQMFMQVSYVAPAPCKQARAAAPSAIAVRLFGCSAIRVGSVLAEPKAKRLCWSCFGKHCYSERWRSKGALNMPLFTPPRLWRACGVLVLFSCRIPPRSAQTLHSFVHTALPLCSHICMAAFPLCSHVALRRAGTASWGCRACSRTARCS